MLSYCSLVWVRGILGEGWRKQRTSSKGSYIVSMCMRYAFVVQLLQRLHPDSPFILVP